MHVHIGPTQTNWSNFRTHSRKEKNIYSASAFTILFFIHDLWDFFCLFRRAPSPTPIEVPVRDFLQVGFRSRFRL